MSGSDTPKELTTSIEMDSQVSTEVAMNSLTRPGPSVIGGRETTSADVWRPLLSSSHDKHGMSLHARIKNYKDDESHLSDHVDFGAEALTSMGDNREEIEHMKQLLSAVRSLPNNMRTKRRYRRELLKKIPHEESHLPFGAYNRYASVKRKIPEMVRDIQNKYNLWSSSFKKIESRFGTGVVSYFVFLRWLLFLKIIIFLVMFVFVVLPQIIGNPSNHLVNFTVFLEVDFLPDDDFDAVPSESSPSFDALRSPVANLENRRGVKNDLLHDLGSLLDVYAVDAIEHDNMTYTRHQRADYCGEKYLQLLDNTMSSTFLSDVKGLFDGSEWMAKTILFLGNYHSAVNIFSKTSGYYNIALAFIIVMFALILVNILMMMSYASVGVQESMLDKLQEMYSYIIFSGWDYCISDGKSAKQQHNSVYQDLKSTLAEDRKRAEQKEWTPKYKAKIYGIRACVHLTTILLLIMAYYTIYYAAAAQLDYQRRNADTGMLGLVFKFLPPMTITGVNFLLPLILSGLVQFEKYKSEQMTNILLLRIILLRQASVIFLVSSFYNQITCEPRDFCEKGYENCPSPMCWETYVGQQMYRLTIMDLMVHIAVMACWEVPRHYAHKKWNKYKLVKMLGTPEFNIPIQVLGLIYSQTLCWLGMFYCPLLPAIDIMKIIIIFYVKKFVVMKNSLPSKTPYKASRSNTIFVMVLMLSFFITIGILGYSATQIVPSPACSPFRFYGHMRQALEFSLKEQSSALHNVSVFIFSPLFAFPLAVLLCLSHYYYRTKSSAYKKMVKLLKVQLAIEGRDKQFLMDRVAKSKNKGDQPASKKKAV